MKRFIAVIRISNISTNEVLALMPREDEIVKELMEEGIITHLFVRADVSGAFIVANVEDAETFKQHLSRLPLFPHMTIEFVELFSMPDFQ